MGIIRTGYTDYIHGYMTKYNWIKARIVFYVIYESYIANEFIRYGCYWIAQPFSF